MDDPPKSLHRHLYKFAKRLRPHKKRLEAYFFVEPFGSNVPTDEFYLILHKMPAIAALIASIDHKSVKEMYEDSLISHVIPLSSPNNSLHSFYTFLQVST